MKLTRSMKLVIKTITYKAQFDFNIRANSINAWFNYV